MAISKQPLRKNCSSIFTCYHEGEKSFLLIIDATVQDLINDQCLTIPIQHLRCFMFEKTISGLLTNLKTNWIFSLLRFLKEFRDFFETGIRLLFFFLCLLNIVEEKLISFIVNFLGWSLRVSWDITSESSNPINFLFWHSILNNYNCR